MAPLLLSAMLLASTPTEAQRLGGRLAESGMLASLLPLMKTKETEELLLEDPGLSPAQQAKLRATADRVFLKGYNRLMRATGDAYAEKLSVSDLRALTRFYTTAVAARYRAATPSVIVATMQSVGQMDFKGDVRAAFCAEEKRLCPRK